MGTEIEQGVACKTAPLSQGFAGWLKYRQSFTSIITEETATGLNTRLNIFHATGHNYSCSGTTQPYVNIEEGLTAMIIGTPLWTDSSLQKNSVKHGHCATLIKAYQAYGEGLTKCLKGVFAFSLVDQNAETAMLGVDRMGRIPLYYYESPDGLLFGTSAQSVISMLAKPASLSKQGLYNYVYFHMVPAPQSVFEGLKKLQAGCIAKSSLATSSIQRYWRPSFSESSKNSRQSLHSTLRDKLKKSVINSLPASGKVGAFLSGGLDSSTVTGMLAEISDGPCDAYSIGFSAEGYDEMAYARITANHFGARLHEYYVTPDDVVKALPIIACAYDEPFGNSSALPAYFCAKLAAEDGVTLLLAGDGGDEIFAGNERYAKQKVFEAYRCVPSFLATNLIEPIVHAMPTWIPLADKARSYLIQANTPLPARLQAYNFLHREVAAKIFQPDFLKSIDTDLPLTLQREIYNTPESAKSLNHMLFLDWQFTLADNDLRKVSQTCALAGVEVAYPMLDDNLVEFSTEIPSDWKLPGNKLRDFYKKALTGWLPEQTLGKSKQGFSLPFGVWMRTHRPLQDMAYDNISKLKSRHIFNEHFLDEAISLHRDGHAAYFGELIWVLTVLELWLENH